MSPDRPAFRSPAPRGAGATGARRRRPGLERLRGDVARASAALARAGLVVGSAGNVSARAGDRVAVTPAGARLAALRAEQVAVVDLDGGLVAGAQAPTSELALHLAVYARLDAAAVVHAHPPMATAVACAADELPCIHYAQLALGGEVPVAPYATFGTERLAASVVGALEGRSAALMAGHGAVTIGADLDAALEAMELLEWSCGVYVHARALGTPRELSGDQRAAVVAALERYRRRAARRR